MSNPHRYFSVLLLLSLSPSDWLSLSESKSLSPLGIAVVISIGVVLISIGTAVDISIGVAFPTFVKVTKYIKGSFCSEFGVKIAVFPICQLGMGKGNKLHDSNLESGKGTSFHLDFAVAKDLGWKRETN